MLCDFFLDKWNLARNEYTVTFISRELSNKIFYPNLFHAVSRYCCGILDLAGRLNEMTEISHLLQMFLHNQVGVEM